MNLKNYTSEVPAARSIMQIEQRLIGAGASNILKSYQDGRVAAVRFSIKLPDGRVMAIQLPARSEKVEKVLRASMKRPRPETLNRLKDQAERTAWRMLDEWVHIQLSLVQIEQVDFLEVFMPYLFDAKSERTYYELMRDNGFKMLPGGKE